MTADNNLNQLSENVVSALGKLLALATRHYGPGPHPGTGTPQAVHGAGIPAASVATMPDLRAASGKMSEGFHNFYPPIMPYELKSRAEEMTHTSFWLSPYGSIFSTKNTEHRTMALRAFQSIRSQLPNDVVRWFDERVKRYVIEEDVAFDMTEMMGFVRGGLRGSPRKYELYLTMDKKDLTRLQKSVIEDMFTVFPEDRTDFRFSIYDSETTELITSGRGYRAFRGARDMVERHYGPGPHPGTGTPQSVHGSGGANPSVAVADVPADIKAMRMFHAVDDESVAQQIISSGQIIPGSTVQGRANLAPVAGRAYATTDIEYALIYALGGNVAGNDLVESTKNWLLEKGRYGYIFEIDPESLDDVQPDEDSIGEAISKNQYPWLDELARKHLSSRDYSQVMHGFYEYWAKAGKKIAPHLTDEQVIQMIRDGAHIANRGTLKFNNVYLVDKLQLPEYPHPQYGADNTKENQRKRVDKIWSLLEPAQMETRHYGPGPHPGTGTPQDVHGHGSSSFSQTESIGLSEKYRTPEIMAEMERAAKLGMRYIIGLDQSLDFLVDVWEKTTATRPIPEDLPPDVIEKLKALRAEDTRESVRARWAEILEGKEPDPSFVEKVMRESNNAIEQLGIVSPVPVLIRKEIPSRDDDGAGQYFGDEKNPDNAYIGIWQSIVKGYWTHKDIQETNVPLTTFYYPERYLGTYIHEFGHHEMDHNPKFAGSMERAEEALNLFRGLAKMNVSKYATEKPGELLAEAYAIYRHPQFDELPERRRNFILYALKQKGSYDDGSGSD